jgi:hypothetical protein
VGTGVAPREDEAATTNATTTKAAPRTGSAAKTATEAEAFNVIVESSVRRFEATQRFRESQAGKAATTKARTKGYKVVCLALSSSDDSDGEEPTGARATAPTTARATAPTTALTTAPTTARATAPTTALTTARATARATAPTTARATARATAPTTAPTTARATARATAPTTAPTTARATAPSTALTDEQILSAHSSFVNLPHGMATHVSEQSKAAYAKKFAASADARPPA